MTARTWYRRHTTLISPKKFEKEKKMEEKEQIILGSGNVHIETFSGTVPDPTEFCKETNRMAYISGGATLEYKPSYYTAKDDSGKKSKTVMTEEEVTLKTGIMTFNSQVFKQMCDTARVSEFTGKNKKTYKRVKFGGISNQRREKYVICFHYEDPVDGDLYVMIVGSNQAGFSLAFAKDKETVTDAEFKAEPMDKEGTLIDFYEESGTASQAANPKE